MIQINNWSSYQSYKDRKPPWIRLHKSLLDNYDFHKMSANARALLPMLWLLASEDKDPVSGAIRYGYETISFRLRLPIKDIKAGIDELAIINDEGESFIKVIQLCSETVTAPLRNRTQTVPSETETETETEKITTIATTPQNGSGSQHLVSWDRTFSGITPEMTETWSKAYPACDIAQHLYRMDQWLLSNPAKAKKKNFYRFITNWLSKSQEKGGR